MTLRLRLTLLSLLGAVSISALLVLGWWFDNQNQSRIRLLNDINTITSDVQNMELSVVNFSLTLELQHAQKFDELEQEVATLADRIQSGANANLHTELNAFKASVAE